jgi:ATPase family associated with various cellular activities (AAA)
MLVQLLQQDKLRDLLLQYLPEFGKAAKSASNNVYRLENGIQVWNSGHHPQQGEPESWATASVYHFFYELDRLLAEAVRIEIFRYLDLPTPSAAATGKKVTKTQFAPKFLDSVVKVRGNKRPLKRFLWDNFVEPLANEAPNVEKGDKFKKGTPISAIFFGPPGTSKTEMSQQVADFLGWPLLAIDPSHLLRNGMDGIQAEANVIFRMLEETERVVVLFDEFDEFVRERGSSDAEQFSRLLTTAMLPKLASIHHRATVVFIIATNNIRQFDLAIRRPGRFDRVVQIMPPTYDEKMDRGNWGPEGNLDVGKTLRRLGVKIDGQVRNHLGDFTFLEFDAFASELARASNAQEALRFLEYHWERCILQSVDQDNKTWKQRCKEEEKFNR